MKQPIKVVVPEQMVQKIKYLCRSIYDVEWSGILFYSMQGSIKDPKNLKFTLEDILPMDKGDKTYTEYELDDRYINYLMEEGQEQRLDWKVGHIHSHNSMGVFFSGTDNEELNDNSSAHNFYLSFIVNNYMDFEAKVAYRGEAETVTEEIPYYALDEEGEKYIVDKAKFTVKKEKLFVHNCEIIAPVDGIVVDQTFADKVKGIIEKAKKKFTNIPKKPFNYKPPYGVPPVTNKHVPPATPTNWNMPDNDDIEDNMFDDDIITSDVELFAVSLLRGTTPPDVDIQNVSDACTELEIMGITGPDLTKSIADNYLPLYAQLYGEDTKPQQFLDIATETIDLYEEYEAIHPILSSTILYLLSVIKKFEEDGATVQ